MNSFLNTLLNRRLLSVCLLGFSSGLPLALTGGTLQAWMTTRNVDLTVIGIFSLVGLPYSLKFLWSPLMDRYIPPFLGRRRGWMIITQVSLILSIVLMAFCDPFDTPMLIAIFAVCVAFSSASQDIVVDAYRAEILDQQEYGMGAAVANLGFRVALLFSGAIALILADHYSWNTVYLLMAAIMTVGLVTSFFSPEPALAPRAPKSLKEALLDPFVEFFRRKGALELLTFVTIYKLDVVVTLSLMTPFILGLGFTKTEIAAVTKGFGLVATLAGTFFGGAWMTKLGIHKSLWVFGILQGVSGFCFYLLAHLGHNYSMMMTTIAVENFFSGMGNVAYFAFLMSLCNPKFTATQYALLTSLMAISRNLVGVPTGWLAKTVGWEAYFLIAILLALPGLLLLTRYKNWTHITHLPLKA